jgi:hypothetical protein
MIAESAWGSPLSEDQRNYLAVAAMFFSAASVYGLNIRLVRSFPTRTVVEKETGHEFKLVPKHDLFFIPVKYWPYVLFSLGVLMVLGF